MGSDAHGTWPIAEPCDIPTFTRDDLELVEVALQVWPNLNDEYAERLRSLAARISAHLRLHRND